MTASAEGAATSFGYDANGNTLFRDRDAGRANCTWDAENRLVQVAGSTGVDTYTDFPGFWGGLSSRRTGAGSEFFASDLSANVRALLDAAGATAQGYLYEAFGPERLGGGGNPYRFGGVVGYYRDGEERRYVRARHYLPDLGRWGSRDPLGVAAGSSARLPAARWHAPASARPGWLQPELYVYVHDAPVVYVDPAGLIAAACLTACVVAAPGLLAMLGACWGDADPCTALECVRDVLDGLGPALRAYVLLSSGACILCLLLPGSAGGAGAAAAIRELGMKHPRIAACVVSAISSIALDLHQSCRRNGTPADRTTIICDALGSCAGAAALASTPLRDALTNLAAILGARELCDWGEACVDQHA